MGDFISITDPPLNIFPKIVCLILHSCKWNKISELPSAKAADILWWNKVWHYSGTEYEFLTTLCTSVALQAAVWVTACSALVVWKPRNGKTSLNWVHFFSFSPSWSVRNVYHMLEKNGILLFSTSVVTLIMPTPYWRKLTSVKDSGYVTI